VNARVLIDVLHDAVLAPAEAIQRGPQGAYVYVVKPDKVVQMRRVQLGPNEGTTVAVRTGLTDSEALVVDGAEKIQDGARVEPTVRKAPAGTSATPGAPGAPNPPARTPRPGA
jgi:multidrug efflux system membrane fusion protein